MDKFTLTQKNEARISFEQLINKEHKSWFACLRTIEKHWDKIKVLAEENQLSLDEVRLDYCVKHLDGTSRCQNGKLGSVKKGVFCPRESWTPKQVFGYACAASRAHFMQLKREERENLKQLKQN